MLTPILQHALDSFFEVGYHGTSVREIARRVGLSVPAVYYHYANKESLLYTLLDGSISSVSHRCEQAVAEAGSEPRTVFSNLVECVVLYMTQHSKRAAMDAEIRALSVKNRKRYAAKRAVVQQLMQNVIEAGAASGDFQVGSPRNTARALLGMLQAIPVWYRADGPMAPREVAISYVDIALHTVAATSAS